MGRQHQQTKLSVNHHPRQWKPSGETDLSSITRASTKPTDLASENFLYGFKPALRAARHEVLTESRRRRVRCCRSGWRSDQLASVSSSRQDEVACATRRALPSVSLASASAVVRPRESTVPSQRNAPEATVTGRRNLVVRSSEV